MSLFPYEGWRAIVRHEERAAMRQLSQWRWASHERKPDWIARYLRDNPRAMRAEAEHQWKQHWAEERKRMRADAVEKRRREARTRRRRR